MNKNEKGLEQIDLDLMGQFNAIFDGVAEAEIKDSELFITIGNRTMVIRLPMVSGAQAAGKADNK